MSPIKFNVDIVLKKVYVSKLTIKTIHIESTSFF